MGLNLDGNQRSVAVPLDRISSDAVRGQGHVKVTVVCRILYAEIVCATSIEGFLVQMCTRMLTATRILLINFTVTKSDSRPSYLNYRRQCDGPYAKYMYVTCN